MRSAMTVAMAALSLLSATTPVLAGEAVRSGFGELPDGRSVDAVTLTNASGMRVRLIAFGAAIESVWVPDRAGTFTDVVLGHASLDGYLDKREYFGATVGRVANRIANGRFVLDGVSYQVPVNNGANSLHGGEQGFDRMLWEIVDVSADPSARVTFRHINPDGEQGYPGTLTAEVTYALDDTNGLSVHYRAVTDRATVVNLSNHAYWNLAGEGAPEGAMGHLLTIPADEYLPTDAGAIPTGAFRAVEGTPFDFRSATPVGARVRDASDAQIVIGRGYDHNWVIRRTRSADLHLVARVEEPVSGRVMEVLSDQPGVQFYSGNFLDGTIVGKSGRLYRMGDAIVLEPQMFPDTPNQPAFGSVRLAPGQEYHNHIVFLFHHRRTLNHSGIHCTIH